MIMGRHLMAFPFICILFQVVSSGPLITESQTGVIRKRLKLLVIPKLSLYFSAPSIPESVPSLFVLH